MTTNAPTNNSNFRNNLIFIADVVLFFILLKVLPFTPEANKGLALLVFVAVLWLTEALHVTVTALLIPLLAIGLGLVKSKQALIAFADPTIFLFFGGFALATALHIQKLDRLIANKIMALSKGKLSVAVLYLFGVTAFLSMWMSNTATAAMMLPLAMGILSKLDLTFDDWIKYGLPIMLILMPLMVGTLYVVFKPKFNISFDQQFEKIELNRQRVLTLVIFLFTALFWVFSSQLNPWISELLGISGKIGSFDSIVALTAAAVVCITRVASWQQVQEGTEWGVLFLFGGGLTLSEVLGQTGASKIMADGIVSLIEGGHFYVIGLIVATFIIFLTEFTSNTASAALLVPIFISIAQALNMPPLGLALIIGLGASCAFMLPVATPPNAIVFGTGEIKQTEMVKAGFWLNIICILVIATIGYLFWLD